MLKVIVALIILVVGGYIIVKDIQIKSDLSKVAKSEYVNENETISNKVVTSEISINRKDGIWSVNNNGEYTIDQNSLVFEFTGYKPGGQHIGTFNNMEVNVSLDNDGNPIISVLDIDISSVKTDSTKLEEHLQTADFFDSAKNPKISVVVSDIRKDNENSVNAITNITMKGITKTLSIPVTVSSVDNGIKFSVDTRINISDFGIAYGPVLNEVRVKAEGILLKK